MPLRHSVASLPQRFIHGLDAKTHPVRDRLGRVFVIRLLLRTAHELSDDDGPHMAAGVAYYAFFSLFPLLLGLITILSWFMESADVQSRVVRLAGSYLPGSSELIASNIEAVFRLRGVLGVFAILGLLWSSSAIFGAVTRAVNRAWDVHRDRPFFISKPRQLGMALGLGVLFLLSLATATFVRFASDLVEAGLPQVSFLVASGGQVLFQAISFLFTILIFLSMYKFMPNTKTYWRYVWPGALVGAVLFETAKNLFIIYLNRFTSFENVYGSLAPVIVLLLWTYISSFVVILGAELSSEYGRLKRGVGRGELLHPVAAPQTGTGE